MTGSTTGDGFVDLVDAEAVADLATFLARARRAGATAVRLQTAGEALAVTVCVLEGHGLMGEGTVLGMRVSPLASPGGCDVVVGVDAVHDRLARMRSEQERASGKDPAAVTRLAIPPVPVVVPWSGMAPPRSGWTPVGLLTGAEVERLASEGIAEVAGAPHSRQDVWRRPIPGTSVPAGAAFAVHALGFGAPELTVHVQGRWGRISSPAGYVLTR